MPSSDLRPRVTILGPVQVDGRDGVPVSPRGARAKTLVVALALSRRGAASADSLIEDLWAEDRPHDPRATLQSLVSRTRADAADGLLVSMDGGYALVATTDLELANQAAREAASALRAGDATLAVRRARDGLALWRGEAGADLQGFASSPVGLELRASSERLQRSLERTLLEALLAAGEHQQAVEPAERTVDRSPLDEDAHGALMRAYAGSGRVADALHTFATLRERLSTELGTYPRPDLTALNMELLQGQGQGQHPVHGSVDGDRASGADSIDGAERSGAEAPARHSPARVHVALGLRAAPNDLVGRHAEIETILGALERSRLVTVLGPGGMGKTRIVQEVARRAADDVPLVAVVELASVRSGDDIALALATVLGIRETTRSTRLGDQLVRAEIRDLLMERLSEVPTLLVLDNCEHVVDDAARWADDLLGAVPRLRILTTSRSPLLVAGEQIVPLEPLQGRASSDQPGPAVVLFAERAEAARPGVELDPAVVERLCVRLDGLPLAIELAAARVRSLSVEEIERRLESRFALLTSGERTGPERHRTLFAVIDWSWNLLTRRQQELLRRLSLFPDGFGMGAAEVLDDVEALVNQSLLTVTDDPETRSARYRMLETVREFGALQLVEAGEEAVALESVRHWAVELCTREAGRLEGARQVSAMLTLRCEQDNLLHVLRGAITDQRPDVVLPVFCTLGMFWSLRGAHSEVVALGPQVLEVVVGWQASGSDAHVEEAAMALLLVAATMTGIAPGTGLRALARLRRLRRRGAALSERVRALVDLFANLGDPVEGVVQIERLHTSSDSYLAMLSHLISAQLAENAGQVAEATAMALRTHAIARLNEDTWGQATSALLLGQLASEQGESATSLRWTRLAREGLSTLHAEEDIRQLDWLEAANEVTVGNLDAAREVFTRLVEIREDVTLSGIGNEPHELRSIGYAGLAEVARAQGDVAEAVRRYELAHRTFGRGVGRRSPWYTMLTAAWLAVLTLPAPQGAMPEDGSAAPPDLALRTASVARELRVRIIALRRAMPGFVDYPVVGTAASALGSYLTAVPSLGRVDDGLRLLQLANRMSARQDMPSMRWQLHDAAARARHGDERVDEVRSDVDAIARDELPDEVHALLRQGPWA